MKGGAVSLRMLALTVALLPTALVRLADAVIVPSASQLTSRYSVMLPPIGMMSSPALTSVASAMAKSTMVFGAPVIVSITADMLFMLTRAGADSTGAAGGALALPMYAVAVDGGTP